MDKEKKHKNKRNQTCPYATHIMNGKCKTTPLHAKREEKKKCEKTSI